MNSKPLISIIINNYNYAPFLRVAINSALNQSYQNYEILIVDDGSTDNSIEIIKSYSDRAKTLFKRNGGQASAFNYGLANANGEIIIFLDSDDALTKNCLERVAEKFSNNPELVCVRWYLEHIDQNGVSLGTTNPMQNVSIPIGNIRNEIINNGWRFNTPPTSGNAFTRACLENFFPMPEDITRCADVYLFANTAVRGKIEMIYEIMGHYRQNLENKNHHLFSRQKIINEILAADITDKALINYLRTQTLENQLTRDRWTTVGDEMLRKILFKFVDCKNISKEILDPMTMTQFFRSHSFFKNIKYIVGWLFATIVPTERIAYWGAGVILGKHNIWGSKKYGS